MRNTWPTNPVNIGDFLMLSPTSFFKVTNMTNSGSHLTGVYYVVKLGPHDVGMLTMNGTPLDKRNYYSSSIEILTPQEETMVMEMFSKLDKLVTTIWTPMKSIHENCIKKLNNEEDKEG